MGYGEVYLNTFKKSIKIISFVKKALSYLGIKVTRVWTIHTYKAMIREEQEESKRILVEDSLSTIIIIKFRLQKKSANTKCLV